MSDLAVAPTDEKQAPCYDEGNKNFKRVSVRELISDPQFRSGYQDRLANLPPPPLYFDVEVGAHDTWGYERGRLVATWLLATGKQPPKVADTYRLVRAYADAEDAGAVL